MHTCWLTSLSTEASLGASGPAPPAPLLSAGCGGAWAGAGGRVAVPRGTHCELNIGAPAMGTTCS